MKRRARVMRKGTGRMDYCSSESEHEIDIEQHGDFSQSSRTVRTSYRTVVDESSPKKRKKEPDSKLPPAMAAEPKADTNPQKERKARKQGASVFMKAFLDQIAAIQGALLSLEADSATAGPCTCRAANAHSVYRCRDCWNRRPCCSSCMVSSHQTMPFHSIERWNGFYFERTSLKDLGAAVYLGHRGRPCKHRKLGHPGRPIVVVDVNGIHEVDVHFCGCPNATADFLQLLRHSLFPATIDQPATVFTFKVLNDFHIHTLASKKSAYDHFAALQRLTDNVAPHRVPNRYHEFQRVGRIWRVLAMKRRAGQAHGIDALLPFRVPGSVAVRCPACIEVGVNVTVEELANAPAERIYLYTMYLSGDGNFRLQRKIKIDDPDDFAILGGMAYFCEASKYEEYLAKFEDVDEDDKSTCANLKVMRMQSLMKFKNLATAGVFAVQCAPHAFFMPQGMVDLPGGEKYRSSDYALAGVLSMPEVPHWVRIRMIYDIWCQYHKNIGVRFEEWFPHLKQFVDDMAGFVPKMHVMGHLEDCQLLYSLNTTEGSGRVHGEGIESTWAEGNQTSGSTKEMNAGHRHDVLDDNHGYWNWQKVIGLPSLLYRRYTNAAASYATTAAEFARLCMRHGDELVAKWEAMDCKPHRVNGSIVSVYKSMATKAPPSQAHKLQELRQQQTIARLSGKDKENLGCVEVINDGLRLEAEQDRIRKLASSLEGEDERAKKARKGLTSEPEERLAKLRAKLSNDLDRWRRRQMAAFPGLRGVRVVQEDDIPETVRLLLPSSFNEYQRQAYGLSGTAEGEHRLIDAAEIEQELRVGQAHDALRDVRQAIKNFNHNLQFKKANIRGQNTNTRAQAFLRSLKADQVSAADKYRRARAALISLGMPEGNEALQPLSDSELWMKNTTERRQLGDTARTEPWFWTVRTSVGMSEDEETEWSMEAERVKWFRDRADLERWREEAELCKEQLRRVIVSHGTLADIWDQLAAETKEPGKRAYAYKHSAMYRQLQDHAKEMQKKIAGHGKAPAKQGMHR